MSKLRLLDLFCGAGGASTGYHRAGFEVVGVDHAKQPNYPFEFIHDDAIGGFWDVLNLDPRGFGAIHASPPCQSYSRAMRHLSAPQPQLIDVLHELLDETRLPWVIENVPGAPLPSQDTLDGRYGVELCGSMFGLRIRRHRLFECSFPISGPACSHLAPAMNPHREEGRRRIRSEFGVQNVDIPWNAEMGVSWMNRYEAREAVPPAYTEFIGARLLDHITSRSEAEAITK